MNLFKYKFLMVTERTVPLKMNKYKKKSVSSIVIKKQE